VGVTYATCAQGEILKYSTSTGWGCAADAGSAGFVSGVVAGTGLQANTITSVGTLNVDVGTTAGKILQLNGSAQIPAVDGSLLAGVSASSLTGRPLSITSPTTGQILQFNGSFWIPASNSAYVNGGNGYGANATIGLTDNHNLGLMTGNQVQ